MCEPTTIIMGTMAIIGAATAVYGMQQQKKATVQMAKKQQEQIDASAQAKKQERMEQARQLRATARAAAAEAGVAGNSVEHMLGDIMGQAGRDVSLIEVNRRNGVDASSAEANARLRVANAEMVQSLANTGTNTYANYQQYKINTA